MNFENYPTKFSEKEMRPKIIVIISNHSTIFIKTVSSSAKLQFFNYKTYIFTKKKTFGTWQFGKIGVLVNYVIKELKFCKMKRITFTEKSSLKPSISNDLKPHTIPRMRLLKCFVLQHSVIKTKHLRSLVCGIIRGFE